VRFEAETHEIAPLIRALDLVILPSRFEGFPNVILEAMACRTPAVATAVGNVPNLVTDRESGLLVDPGDAAGLANAMVAVCQMTPAERERMGSRGREVAEAQFEIKAVARAYLTLYRTLLEERCSGLTCTSS
jgi:glycosyltransferase involved in cell wall biosynthesis